MSMICLLEIQDTGIDRQFLKKRIKELINGIGGVFFYDSMPVVGETEGCLYCSFSDDYRFDNCERLLLPDEDVYNGSKNPIPFRKRVQTLERVLRVIMNLTIKGTLYVGNNGNCRIDEFTFIQLELKNFVPFMEQYFNGLSDPSFKICLVD